MKKLLLILFLTIFGSYNFNLNCAGTSEDAGRTTKEQMLQGFDPFGDIKNNDLERLRLSLEKTQQRGAFMTNDARENLLAYAIKEGRFDIAKFLLKNINVAYFFERNYMPLDYAIEQFTNTKDPRYHELIQLISEKINELKGGGKTEETKEETKEILKK